MESKVVEYDIRGGVKGDNVVVIGFVHWNPERWDYQTDDEEVASVLNMVKTEGAVEGFTSFATEEAIYDFIPCKVESSNPRFIGLLSDYISDKIGVWFSNEESEG